jgi:hypothetical protein
MDGFTYENMPGGWSVCDVCGVRVSEELKHQAWHEALGQIEPERCAERCHHGGSCSLTVGHEGLHEARDYLTGQLFCTFE